MTIVSVEVHIQDSFICKCEVFNAHLTINACRLVFPPVCAADRERPRMELLEV